MNNLDKEKNKFRRPGRLHAELDQGNIMKNIMLRDRVRLLLR